MAVPMKLIGTEACSPKGKTVNSRPDEANRDGSLFPEGENRE
jgi:hypothetical protein